MKAAGFFAVVLAVAAIVWACYATSELAAIKAACEANQAAIQASTARMIAELRAAHSEAIARSSREARR